MKIYNSNEYIEKPKVGDLRLSVNSMWNFGSRSVCFNRVDGIGGENLISYDIEKCTEIVDEKAHHTKWKQAEITDGIISELQKKGYTVGKDFLTTSNPVELGSK